MLGSLILIYNNHPKIRKTMDGGHQENSKTTNHRHIDWLNPRSIPRPWQTGFVCPVSTKTCLFSGSNSGWCPLMSWFINPMKTSSLYLHLHISTINHSSFSHSQASQLNAEGGPIAK